ncbi:GntR family transcriptional regulator [Ensifer sp. IC4062]|nr:GntR family transcriptional regulator [Ensifer sp. IC4062]MCA1441929.1 GntR family transcriptional regulator [Ensifer sp. IC4062]
MENTKRGQENVSTCLELLRGVSISELVYEQVRQRILSGELQVGQHINEKRLAASLGVSRASVREALRQLEKDGLIEITKNKGPFVRDMPPEEAWELYDVRASLEALAAELAAKNRSDSDLRLLAQCLQGSEHSISVTDEALVFESPLNFHRLIAVMSGSHNVLEMLKGVWGQIALFRRKFPRLGPGVSGDSVEERIVSAIQNRNAEQASALMRSFVLDGKDEMIKIAQNYPEKHRTKNH